VFQGKQKREDAEHQLEQEVERLKALSPQQVGVELIKLVDPFDLDADGFPVGALAKCLAPSYGRLRGPRVEEFQQLIDEGAQAMANAGLFTSVGWGGVGDGNVYGLSRSGRDALANGSVEDLLGGGASKD
jgi:hypothetical protein